MTVSILKSLKHEHGQAFIGLIGILVMVCGLSWAHYARADAATASKKIKHIVIIMQENRSFDNYFGTFPGADGIPMRNGVPTVCSPDNKTGQCIKPYVDNADVNEGGPHAQRNATGDIQGGAMNGFITQYQNKTGQNSKGDVMGYHTESTLHNYWAYAKNYVLNDHMFASSDSWSLPEHLFMVSEWSADCPKFGGPRSCTNDVMPNGIPPDKILPSDNFVRACAAQTITATCRQFLQEYKIGTALANRIHNLLSVNCNLYNSYIVQTDSYNSNVYYRCDNAIHESSFPKNIKQVLINDATALRTPNYAWTDITYLLHKYDVSWRYYVMNGTEPDCQDDAAVSCASVGQNSRVPGIWNPLPYFQDVREDNQTKNIQTLANFYKDAKNGTLPAVSWITPSQSVSEHPPARVSNGQAYVTGLINTIMKGPNWQSTAIFVSWDDWGGFYDNLNPPHVDKNGYGLRVPGLVISPYAKRGYIDHQTLSHDAYSKFIEDVFLNGQRIDPRTDGRADNRTGARENQAVLGDLSSDFNFAQTPRRPMVLNGQIVF